MHIQGHLCRKCTTQINDEFDECRNCKTPYTPYQDLIAREHYRARLALINKRLATRKMPDIPDELLLRSITETLRLMNNLKVMLREKTIVEFFQSYESRMFS